MQLNIIFYKTFIICLTHTNVCESMGSTNVWILTRSWLQNLHLPLPSRLFFNNCICLCLRGSSPKIGLVFSEQLLVFSGYFERVSTASQCRKIQNHYHHRYYGFFRRLFGVKNVATWSFLVVEATGDWKVG